MTSKKKEIRIKKEEVRHKTSETKENWKINGSSTYDFESKRIYK